MAQAPAHLFGRASESQKIDASLRVGVRKIIITGEAGVGKSTLALSIIEKFSGRSALIGMGKHGVGDTGAGPLLIGVRQLVDAALEELFDPHAGYEQLRAAMGPALSLFDQLMAHSEAAVGSIKNADILAEQLAYVLERIIKWLAGFGLPIILLVDDWDRASAEVGRLYLRLASIQISTQFCLIVTGRTRQSAIDHIVPDSLSLSLIGLDQASRLAMLCEALGPDNGAFIDGQLPAAINRPLDVRQRCESVSAQLALGKKIDDPETLAAALQDDLAFVFAQQIEKLPQTAADALILASIIGDSIDAHVLAIATGQNQTQLRETIGLLMAAKIMRRAGEAIIFPHDTIRAAIITCFAANDVSTLARYATKRLLAGLSHEPQCQTALESLLLAHPPENSDPEFIPAIHDGVKRALQMLDVERATQLANLALKMDGGVKNAQLTTLALLAQAAFAGGQLDNVLVYACELRAKVRQRSDIAFAYAISARAARALGDRDAAIKWALEGHRLLGWDLPANPSFFQAFLEILWTNIAGDIMRALPPKKVAPDLALVELCATTATIFFEYGTRHVISMARRYALSPGTSWTRGGLSAALFLANFLGRRKLASKLGDKIIGHTWAEEPFQPPSIHRANFFGKLWTEPTKSFELVHDQIYALALADGDLSVSTWALRNKAHLFWRAGGHLAEIEPMAMAAREFSLRVGNQSSADAAGQIWLAARQLQAKDTDPEITIDPYCPHTLDTGLLTWLGYHNFSCDFAKSLEILSNMPRKLSMGLSSHPGCRDFQFHRAIAMLMGENRLWPEDLKAIKLATKFCPQDHAGRLEILKALVAKQSGKIAQAYKNMVAGVQISAQLGRLPDLNLAHCLAADLAKSLGNLADEANHIEQARRAWNAWGADNASHQKFAASTFGAGIGEKYSGDIQSLARKLEQSERENRAKARLLAMVGHELRTPLQAISGAVDLIEAESGQTENLSIALTSIDRLSVMIDDLADASAVDAGRLAIHPRPFLLADLLRHLVQTHAERLESVGMALSLNAPMDSEIHLLGDDKRLLQILDNLLNNARKYGAGEVEIALSNSGDQWRFDVTDEGVGLSEEQAVKIFEPFVRGAQNGEASGHGIGLWLARKLAEAMGGQLLLVPRPSGKIGAHFSLTLPMARAKAAPVAVAGKAGTIKNILLIEDEPLSRDVLTRLLAIEGHKVSAFSGGPAALKALGNNGHDFDYALVDFNMPELDGLQTAAGLRQLPGLSGMKIILMSAQLKDELLVAHRHGHIDQYVQKPLNLGIIRRLIGHGSKGKSLGKNAALKIDAAIYAQLGQYCDEAAAAQLGQNWQNLEIHAHKLAGAALMFGAQDLGQTAVDLENCAKSQDSKAAKKMIAAMKKAFTQLAH